MRRIFSFGILFFIVVLTYFSISFSEDTSFSNDSIRLSGSMRSGLIVNIVIYKKDIGDKYPYGNSLMWGGDDLHMPDTLVSGMDVRIDNVIVFIPLSAYADLGNPNAVSLNIKGSAFDIIIKGGDASGSYKATLVFSDGCLRKRKVTGGEFPDKAWEEAVYSFVANCKKSP